MKKPPVTVRQVRLWWRLNQSGRASRSVRMGTSGWAGGGRPFGMQMRR